ncbi:MAG: hypothetical protein V3T17_09360 [Pseudomonadales bacterium]
MTRKNISLEDLLEVQATLKGKLLAALTEDDRELLKGFKRGEPDWSLSPFSNAKELPGVRWKQFNLDKMSKDKRHQAIEKLTQVLDVSSKQKDHGKGELMSYSTPQQQLAQEITDALIDHKLIDENRRDQLQQQIAKGSLKPEDWSLLVDIALELDGKEQDRKELDGQQQDGQINEGGGSHA